MESTPRALFGNVCSLLEGLCTPSGSITLLASRTLNNQWDYIILREGNIRFTAALRHSRLWNGKADILKLTKALGTWVQSAGLKQWTSPYQGTLPIHGAEWNADFNGPHINHFFAQYSASRPLTPKWSSQQCCSILLNASPLPLPISKGTSINYFLSVPRCNSYITGCSVFLRFLYYYNTNVVQCC